MKKSALAKAVEESGASLIMKNELMDKENDVETINNV